MDEATRLLLAGRSGDVVSLTAWIRMTQADVWRLCAHLVDRSDADDLTQEVYARVHAALPGFRGEASARTWLLAIARNLCADTVRRRQRLRLLRAMIPVASPVPSVSAQVELMTLIADLPSDRREALVLTQIVGLSYAEAAAVCGCPLGTIRSRVARARADLMAALADEAGAGAGA
ncbi:MAG TPA: sigma-70 family RNA polymerase sigma factor [Acidimicrobiia bacterium]